MNKPLRLGPFALLIAVIGVCLAVLAMLTLATAGADLRLAERHAQTVRTRYALETQGQEYLQDLRDGETPAEAPGADGVYLHTIEENGAKLTVGVVPDPDGGWRTVVWTLETIWTQDPRIDGLWDGN